MRTIKKKVTIDDFNISPWNNIPQDKVGNAYEPDQKYYRNWNKLIEGKTFQWHTNKKSSGQLVQAVAIIHTPEIQDFEYGKNEKHLTTVVGKIGFATDHYFESYFFPNNWMFKLFPRFFAKRILVKEFGETFTKFLAFNPEIKFTTDILIPVVVTS